VLLSVLHFVVDILASHESWGGVIVKIVKEVFYRRWEELSSRRRSQELFFRRSRSIASIIVQKNAIAVEKYLIVVEKYSIVIQKDRRWEVFWTRCNVIFIDRHFCTTKGTGGELAIARANPFFPVQRQPGFVLPFNGNERWPHTPFANIVHHGAKPIVAMRKILHKVAVISHVCTRR
jgi:hypothetical protein